MITFGFTMVSMGTALMAAYINNGGQGIAMFTAGALTAITGAAFIQVGSATLFIKLLKELLNQ